jgi:SecD/SecF fusion protein
MSEVLTRSLATSFSTLLAVGSLLVFGGATLQDFAFAMLVGIASGTYSSIFIASPVLTAWKEREAGYARRRTRIAEVEGTVPAYADEVELAKLSDDDERDEQIAAGAEGAASEPEAGAVATAERTGDGAGPAANGEPTGPEPAGSDPASAERRARNEERRARRAQRRRKHGRNR